MNKILLLLTTLLGLSMTLMSQTQTVNGFESSADVDTVYWGFDQSDNAVDDSSYANLTLSDNAAVGDSSMRIEYSTISSEGWGGYCKIEHWHPDTNSVYNWSAFDSISFRYYVDTKQSLEGKVHLRFNLYEVSNAEDGAATYDVNDLEFYYSFHYILDAEPGWNKIKMPLVDNGNWDGEGFNRTGWTGIEGNAVLDKDQIKGWTFEFSIGGNNSREVSEGVLLIDELALENPGKVEVIYFNGRDFPANVSDRGVWGNSSYEVVEGAGYTAETNAIKWAVGGAWNGVFFKTASNVNMSFVWGTDSLKFKAKAPTGTGPFRVWFEDTNDPVGKSYYSFDPAVWNWDGTWKMVELSLNKDLVIPDPHPVDSSNIKGVVFMTEDGFSGDVTEIFFDDMWTGNPIIDITPPEAPTGLTVTPNAELMYNTISWTDVEGEEGEGYKVYSSLSPITDVEAAGVDFVGTVGESESAGNATIEYLLTPVTSQNLSLYYAVTCTDSWGNVSEVTATAAHTANNGKAIPTIPVEGPANFVADGDFSEWTNAPFVLNPVDAYVTMGTVDDKADLDGNVYVAIDSNFLYIGADVIDDVYEFGTGDWWNQDAFELFIGLYSFDGKKHSSNKSGAEPDYKIIVTENNVNVDWGAGVVHEDTSAADFYFENFGADYVFETKISLDSLGADGDARFYPTADDRILITITFHDNDGTGHEGNVGLSPYDKDTAHQTPTAWVYTWLGDGGGFTDISDDNTAVPERYSLRNNYPNPFNPSTTIAYFIPNAGDVKVEIFNVLGQRVMTLVDGKQLAGQHKVTFDAKDLSSGVYFYRLKAGNFNQTKKMMLVK